MAFARRTNQRVTLLMLVLASVTVLALDYHGEASRAIGHIRHGVAEVLSPFQRAVAAALHPIGDVVSGSIHYGELQTQNEQLRSKLGALNERLAANNIASESAKQVLSLAGLPFVGDTPTVPAEVISGPASNFEATVEINRGTSSGVGSGMPVVADGGLIGTVTSASANTATVRLISDHRSTVGVRDAKDDLFISSGGGLGHALSLTILPGGTNTTTVTARKGDLLETSTQDAGAYPAGIPVAMVSGVRTPVGGTPQAVSATPVVNLSDLGFVAVVQWVPSA